MALSAGVRTIILPGKYKSSAERPTIDAQGGDARRQCRRLDAEQLCRTARSRNLAVRLHQGGSNSIAFLTLQLLTREQRLLCGQPGIFAGILAGPRGGEIKSQWTFLP